MRAAFATCLALLTLLVAPPVFAETSTATGAASPFVYVTVAGAPGDGDQALAAALARQLAARGLKSADAFQANVYEVQGTVRVAPAAKGKESVTIIWVVLAPDGNQLGVTRQTKDVRKGSLNRTWGKAADAAAGAAAEDIAKLIPRE
ncbi:MAG TPA: hypothetical protein VFI85_08260 [Methyloceanibacter sp.]|nr:hypothetical protein [Methyloceanibacter sp.]